MQNQMTNPLPSIGTEIYVPQTANCTGGKAIISKYEFYNKSTLNKEKNTIRDKHNKTQSVGLMVNDIPSYIWVWENLELRQDELKDEFGDIKAKYISPYNIPQSLKLPEELEGKKNMDNFGFNKKRDNGMGINQFK